MKCSFDGRRDEVRPSICPAGLSLKWRSLTTTHSTLRLQQVNQRGEETSPRPGKKLFVRILQFSIIVCFSYCIITNRNWFGTFSVFWFADLLIAYPELPTQAHFLSWVTQHPPASSPLLPGSCPGGARKRTRSSWRTSWCSGKRISGELKESKVCVWKRSFSLVAYVTLTWPPKRATVCIQTGAKCWTPLLLEIRVHEWLNSLWTIKSTQQPEQARRSSLLWWLKW